MKKQLMIFDFVCLGIGAIFLTFVAILQNCGINITNGSVIGIVITVLLFTLILLSTANVLGFDCTVSNITFLRPILLFIALYIFYCMPFMGFFGKSGNVWNNIMIASFGIMASRFFFYISTSFPSLSYAERTSFALFAASLPSIGNFSFFATQS